MSLPIALLVKALINIAVTFGMPWLLKHVHLPQAVQDVLNKLLSAMDSAVPIPSQVQALKLSVKHEIDKSVFERRHGVDFEKALTIQPASP